MRLGLAVSAATLGGIADTPVLVQAAVARGVQARLIDWRGTGWDWPDAVLLHAPWDYSAHVEEFTTWLHVRSARTPVINPPASTAANLHKSYLLELAAAGIPVPVTRLLPAGDALDEDDLRATFGDGPVVVKPAVGAGGRGMSRLPDVAALRSSPHVSGSGAVRQDVLVQEFLPAVHAGEHSLVAIGGQASHLVHKVAAPGEYRVQASHGGSERLVDADAASADVAGWVGPLLAGLAYARVDYVVDPQRGPLVMELELTEPDLFLRHHPPAAHALVGHIVDAVPAR